MRASLIVGAVVAGLLVAASQAFATHYKIVVESCHQPMTGKAEVLGVTVVDSDGRMVVHWPGETYRDRMNKWAKERIDDWERHPAQIIVVRRGRCAPKTSS